MMENQPKTKRSARLEVARKFNSLIINMTKTSTIIIALAGAIENDEAHLEEDVAQSVAFIDQQIDMIKRAKESILQLVKQPEDKKKKDA